MILYNIPNSLLRLNLSADFQIQYADKQRYYQLHSSLILSQLLGSIEANSVLHSVSQPAAS